MIIILSSVASQGDQIYHGTTAANGRMVQRQGYLQPLSAIEGGKGNWGGGSFGGNPSNPNNIYCTVNRNDAIEYAKEICQLANTSEAALITVVPNWDAYVPDEDAVADHLVSSSGPSDANSLIRKAWLAYAKVLGMTTPEQAYGYFHNLPDPETAAEEGYDPNEAEEEGFQRNNYELNDAQYAQDMKDTAETLASLFSPLEMRQWISSHPTGSFSRPLKATNVEFFGVGQG